jgi:hypothetical protein
VVADLHDLKATSDGIEPSRLGCEVFGSGISPTHDEGYAVKRRVFTLKPILA